MLSFIRRRLQSNLHRLLWILFYQIANLRILTCQIFPPVCYTILLHVCTKHTLQIVDDLLACNKAAAEVKKETMQLTIWTFSAVLPTRQVWFSQPRDSWCQTTGSICKSHELCSLHRFTVQHDSHAASELVTFIVLIGREHLFSCSHWISSVRLRNVMDSIMKMNYFNQYGTVTNLLILA